MSIFSFLAGVLTGGVLLAWIRWLRHNLARGPGSPWQMSLIAVGLLATFALAATVIYLTVARPHAAGAVAQAAPDELGSGDTARQAQSMEVATANLAARLARGGGSDQEWELLAKSYDFLGRSEDARLARDHKVSSAAAASTGVPPPSSMRDALRTLAETGASGGQGDEAAIRAPLEQKLKHSPKDIPALLGLAALEQNQRHYAAAQERYRQVIALKGMTADAWADYADALAALAGGSLAGEAAEAIEHALTLDPRHGKALWLKASRAYQEHRYADALALWKTLRASLPADSPDISVIESNIAEATQLASRTPAAGASTAAVAVTGTVSIDDRLASLVSRDATLFIYARAAGEQGPPVAVIRMPVGSWPVSFRLDDSMAMIPTRKLSQFEQVIVEARVSRTGQATPAAGDLFIKSDVIRPADGRKLTLVISQKIG
jgi:cytochrome c-type biogenesis protein CcmH/NrfG